MINKIMAILVFFSIFIFGNVYYQINQIKQNQKKIINLCGAQSKINDETSALLEVNSELIMSLIPRNPK